MSDLDALARETWRQLAGGLGIGPQFQPRTPAAMAEDGPIATMVLTALLRRVRRDALEAAKLKCLSGMSDISCAVRIQGLIRALDAPPAGEEEES